jgi:hypothetical protein
LCTLYSTADTGSASAVIGQPCCHTATVDTVSGGLKLLLFEDEFDDPEVVKTSLSSTVEMNDDVYDEIKVSILELMDELKVKGKSISLIELTILEFNVLVYISTLEINDEVYDEI